MAYRFPLLELGLRLTEGWAGSQTRRAGEDSNLRSLDPESDTLLCMGRMGGASKRDQTSDLLITNRRARPFKLLIINVVRWVLKSIALRLCSPASLPRMAVNCTSARPTIASTENDIRP
jgi:hypothetical protein